ncbi:PD-(D/E)XK motif protein [Kordiimonas lipolytica]|uniref:PD-(D/E)XK motif protein n=1 Tax=Kordiimonas lipolytica TaxID=1662421 RepID=A0ABV8U7L2_9PROT|nr:PD-(D/E)XK motif protein [Kordiimonas lipolytica]
MSDQWDLINTPEENGTSLTRVLEGSHNHKFWRGKNQDGNLLMQYEGQFDADQIDIPHSTQAIKVSASCLDNQTSVIEFTLTETEERELFRVLCRNLIECVKDISGQPDLNIARRILMRYRRWQDLLHKAKTDTLSEQAQLGLFGELFFLRHYAMEYLNTVDAVSAWRGPLGEEQDFSVLGKLIEVKTQKNSSDRKVQISSAEQLDICSGPIFLFHQTFALTGTEGTSLNELIETIIQSVGAENITCQDELHHRLLEAGYAYSAEYDQRKYIPCKTTFYDVSEHFPAIRASLLTAGVSDVKYRISLNTCTGFLMDKQVFLEEVFNVPST